MTSPYAAVLGERMADLHPSLQRYFSSIPDGGIGIGEGVFSDVGAPRAWLRPFLRPLERRGVVWSGRAHDVPFQVVNRTIDGRAVAERTLRLPTGDWTMHDVVSRSGRRVVDRIGRPGLVAAAFDVEVRGGALVLESRAVGIRAGRLRVAAPGWLRPAIRLVERHDDATGLQHVTLTVDVPLLGRVYGYDGTFAYRIEPSR